MAPKQIFPLLSGWSQVFCHSIGTLTQSVGDHEFRAFTAPVPILLPFLTTVTETLTWSNLREEGFILAYSPWCQGRHSSRCLHGSVHLQSRESHEIACSYLADQESKIPGQKWTQSISWRPSLIALCLSAVVQASKILPIPRTEPPAGAHMFKHMSFWGTLHMWTMAASFLLWTFTFSRTWYPHLLDGWVGPIRVTVFGTEWLQGIIAS